MTDFPLRLPNFKHQQTEWERHRDDDARAPSIDRLVAAEGYVPGNVRIVCWIYNSAKLDWPESLVLRMARALVNKEGLDG